MTALGLSRPSSIDETIRKLYPLPVIIVVEEWVDSNLAHVDDGGEDDPNEVAPERSFFDGSIFLAKSDAERLQYWMKRGYRLRAILSRP